VEELSVIKTDGDKGFDKEIDSDLWEKTISVLRQGQTKKTLLRMVPGPTGFITT